MNPIPIIHDIRHTLPRATWSIGTRRAPPRYLTLHYNGPLVAERSPRGELRQLTADARYQMRPGGLGSPKGGDGLQYHYAVGADGTIYQCRDEAATLWHCAHATGNQWSLSIHLPLGGEQDATDEQWASTLALFTWLCARCMIPTGRVRGHQEWSGSQCPGPHLMPRLRTWRSTAPATVLAKQGMGNNRAFVI